MVKIGQHIEKLLAQHDYVVVPNLGGFVVQTKSAEILSNRIIPPLTTIGFNPLMSHSDGLLAIEIAKLEAVSFRMAMEVIDKEITEIKSQLRTKGAVQLANLGELQQNASGNIFFLPNTKAEYLPMNFGLTDIFIAERVNQQTEERRKITFTMPSTRMCKYAAACVLIFSLLFVSPRVNDMRHANSADLSSIVFVNTSKIVNSTPKLIIPSNITTSDTIAGKRLESFHVIVASLSSQKSAEDYCKVLTEAKFLQAHVLPPSKIYRVAVQSFSDREAAIQYMENLRKTDSRFETAWVLCN